MEKKDKVSVFTLISTCGCAVIWSILVFVDLYYGPHDKGLFTLHIACAVIWDICAVLSILRYIKSRKKTDG